MEPILEFNYKFEGDEEEHVINIQTKSDTLIITIELESKGLYWYRELDSKSLTEMTSQMGSYKSLKVFTDMLIQALSKKNDSLSLNFCSLVEIKQMMEPNEKNSIDGENDMKKFLIMMYTSFEKVMYPIKMEFLGNSPNKELLQRTIVRLRNKVKKLKEENLNNSFNNNKNNLNNFNFNENSYVINYNDYEKIKEENENLKKKLNFLEKDKNTVNDDIFKKYNELSEKYDTYKKLMENKMKSLVASLEELKEKETERLNKEKNNKLNQKNKNISKIVELEKKLEISSEQLLNERKQNSKIIEDKNHKFRKRIRT